MFSRNTLSTLLVSSYIIMVNTTLSCQSSYSEYLAYGYVGWVDWNMVLNYTGGFTYIDYLADAPIIISQDSTEFYKQPMFYVLGHFSKFIVPGSVRLKASLTGHGLKAVAFVRPDKLKAIVILNESRENIPMKLNDVDREPVVVNIPGKSLQTILYQAE